MVNEGRGMTNREYRKMFGVGSQTAARELKGLVEKGQARRVGQGRATQYEAI
jgi:predicted HTH transcriptional regulator